MSSVLVTGASGFVGRAVCQRLLDRGFHVRGSHRLPERQIKLPVGVERVLVPSVDGDTDWSPALAEIDAVVHLAARVHVMKDRVRDPLAAFRELNTTGTLRLARMAAASGVRRFVYLSSIKVNGEQILDAPFTETDPPRPEDPYAISKWEAEQLLHSVAAETGLEVVILRPPLVYGRDVGANFLRLMDVVHRRIPLPFGLVRNRRSLLYVDNLADAIATCIIHPGAAGQTFLVSDGEDLSTADLVRYLARALRSPARLLPVPPSWLRLFGALTGRSPQVKRLLGSLAIDSSRIRRELAWAPPYSVSQGLEETADWYLAMRAGNHSGHAGGHRLAAF